MSDGIQSEVVHIDWANPFGGFCPKDALETKNLGVMGILALLRWNEGFHIGGGPRVETREPLSKAYDVISDVLQKSALGLLLSLMHTD